jgi:hypothetical protein
VFLPLTTGQTELISSEPKKSGPKYPVKNLDSRQVRIEKVF